jgi:hypothetical protein
MNSDLLERLLVDRAFGQLSPDVMALLSEHLGANQEAAKLADELAETVEVAAAAIKRPHAIETLPTPIPALFRREQARRVLAIAASFVAGAGVVLFGMRATRSQNDGAPRSDGSRTLQVAMEQTPLPMEVERAAQGLPFWSNQRIYLVAAAAKQSKPEKNLR